MKKRIKQRKFGMKTDQRRAFLKILASNLILNERISTTLIRAKAIRPLVEKLITKGREDNFNTARYLESRLSQRAAQKIRKELGPKYADRPGGYLRIIKVQSARNDLAPKAIIEFVDKQDNSPELENKTESTKSKPETKKKK